MRKGGLAVKIVKWIGIVLGTLIAILLIANAIWVWRSGAKLRAEIEAIRAAGDPVTLPELAGQPIAPEKNADTYLSRAEKDLEAIGRELNEVYSSDAFHEGRLSAEHLALVEKTLAAYPDVLPLLEQAAAAEEYHPEIDYSLPPDNFITDLTSGMSRLRLAARLLHARSLLLAKQGDRDAALYSAMLTLRLARCQDPMLIGYLVSVAVRGLAIDSASRLLQGGPVSNEQHQELETLLARHDAMAAFREALRSERPYMITSFRQTIPGRDNWLMRAYWDREELACLELIEQELAVTERPFREARKVRDETGPGSWSTLARLTAPAAEQAREAAERDRANVACLRVVNALVRREKPDELPRADLSDLGLPAEATRDPFSGEPLRVKKVTGGWLVYSVGADLNADGGDDEKDVILAPTSD